MSLKKKEANANKDEKIPITKPIWLEFDATWLQACD